MKSTLEEIYQIYLKHPVISKDTRDISEGCIYLALKGESFDGNKFAEDALNKGAAYVIIDNERYRKDNRYLLVEDSLKTLQQLANYHRRQLSIPIISISGSNGKTTTKELIAAGLSGKYKVLYTEGNYNNHIGVPLTLLRINPSHEIAVIEMGANHQKEIDFLCHIAEPNFGMLTNIGKAHLEGFGGIEGVLKGKTEMYRFLEKTNGTVFLNTDDDKLVKNKPGCSIITYGTKAESNCMGNLNQTHPTLKGNWTYKDKKGEINSKLYGEYNFYNMMAAICIANYFEVESLNIDQQINSYESDMNRSQMVKYENYKVYLDAYNANPSSVKLAIENFEKNDDQNKVALLGDMFELGEAAATEHKRVVEQLQASNKVDLSVLVGKNFYQHKIKNDDFLFFETTEDAKIWFQKENKVGKAYLIKGSRGMKMESLLD